MQNKSKNYDAIINQLAKESGQASWSNWFTVALIIISLVMTAAVAICIFAYSADLLVVLFIFFAGGAALFIPVGIYYHRAGVYALERCLELENIYPGIIDAYDDWKRKERENSIPDSHTF